MSLLVLIVLLIVSVAGSVVTSLLIRDQEHRLLRERTAEVGLVLTEAINAIPATLGQLGADLSAGQAGAAAFRHDALSAIAADKTTPTTLAWLKPAPTGFRVLTAVGPGMHVGEVVTGVTAQTMRQALTSPDITSTPVMGTGADRTLGFALGPPAAPAGSVVYRQTNLGPLAPPRQAGTAPFAELDVALYASPGPNTAQVLVSTSKHLPLHGGSTQTLPVGHTSWLLVAAARRPLVGPAAAFAWLDVLIVGTIGSLLLAAVTELTARRRDDVLALYAAEHELAATLQLSLLPELPDLAGLDLAARYIAGNEHQHVGGDWFDVFPLDGGRVGIAVGDVMGHDIEAAAAMASARAALRTAAWRNQEPGAALEEVDHVITHFGLSQLITVVYGVLDPPDPTGSRHFRYANAGHLPPIVRDADGNVHTLLDGTSVLIGAPIPIEHDQGSYLIPAGAALILHTDGLVETPGASLDDGLNQITNALAEHGPLDAEEVCKRIVDARQGSLGHDDLALLVARLTATPTPSRTARQRSSSKPDATADEQPPSPPRMTDDAPKFTTSQARPARG